MAGHTGKNRLSMTFNGAAIPNVTSIEWTNSADEVTLETADGMLTEAGVPKWSVAIQFAAPATATHTLQGSIQAGEVGALTCDVGATRYTHSAAKSLGFTHGGTPGTFLAFSLNLTMDGAPTLAAAS